MTFNLFFPLVLSLFLIGWEFYVPNDLKCWNLSAGPAASAFPQCPCRSRLSFSVSCCLGTSVSDSGESLHCFLVGVSKGYVIATSDLWLFIHASKLLPSLPTPLPYTRRKLTACIHKQLVCEFVDWLSWLTDCWARSGSWLVEMIDWLMD